MPLRLYNTLTKSLQPLVPIDPANLTFYTCGPTVYDDAHIGNFRSFLAADLLRRWLESPLCELTTREGTAHRAPAGRRVTHVMNITDVGHMTDDAAGGEHGEDRMAVAGQRLLEAKKSGRLPANVEIDPRNPHQIAAFYADRFVEDARRLGLKVALEAQHDPTLMPRATANIGDAAGTRGMTGMIRRLIERGHAYAVGPGDPGGGGGGQTVYFAVTTFDAYGALSGNTLDRLREGAGGRISEQNQSGKRHPADFLLWKSDPSHLMKWPSPWGEGYPGWHIECSVMSAARLRPDLLGPGGEGGGVGELPDGQPIIDVHSGGEDNIFPHHECEIAQSCAAFNSPRGSGPYAAMWFHPRFLLVEGDKMSKSKGNFFTARDLFEKGVEPAALRLELIRTHYRSNANFTMQGLTDSQRLVDRWRRFAEAAPGGGAATNDSARSEAAQEAARAFADAMHDDLNIAGAIAAVNTFVGFTASPTAEDIQLLRTIDAVLGVLDLERPAQAQTDIGVFLGGLAPDPAVVARLEDRAAARRGKDFKRSDAIRDELLAMGYAIKDAAGGKVEVSRA
ncbi:MAG: cysteine--tRNA ligase [Phycisphaerales bacterium]|nr:cysteine--tRNA ligase [Phycisphaerales bacterium]